jgi:hypothetical protein
VEQTVARSCPMVGFDISGMEHSSFASTSLLTIRKHGKVIHLIP